MKQESVCVIFLPYSPPKTSPRAAAAAMTLGTDQFFFRSSHRAARPMATAAGEIPPPAYW